ncbi:pyroglutamyl-peptidase I, partial [Allofournierella massiliensis]|uniref:pyroglutamyl-peptidase I n=1 Tax=Allofournierella massiliensis TaxID=1650663 RepID=UPI0024B0AF59
MKVLVTGFDPFGGEAVNPAFEAVKLLPDQIAGAQIIKLEIPTVFTRSARVVEQAMEEHKPDIVIDVGQAGGRSCMTVEKVAINLAEARIPDNDGEQPFDEPLRADGETAYFATVPVKAMVENMRKHGIPAHISYTAGTYVCNSIMYNVLYLAAKIPGCVVVAGLKEAA